MPNILCIVNKNIAISVFVLDFSVAGYFRRSPPAATGGNLQNNPKTADSCCSPANTKQFTLKLQTKLQKVVAGLTVENEN